MSIRKDLEEIIAHPLTRPFLIALAIAIAAMSVQVENKLIGRYIVANVRHTVRHTPIRYFVADIMYSQARAEFQVSKTLEGEEVVSGHCAYQDSNGCRYLIDGHVIESRRVTTQPLLAAALTAALEAGGIKNNYFKTIKTTTEAVEVLVPQ